MQRGECLHSRVNSRAANRRRKHMNHPSHPSLFIFSPHVLRVRNVPVDGGEVLALRQLLVQPPEDLKYDNIYMVGGSRREEL